MSIRLRLTVLFTVLLALTLALGGVALYVSVARMTFATLAETLANDTRQLVNTGRFRMRDLDGPAWRLGASPTLFQTRNLDGAVLDRSQGLGAADLPLGEEGLASVRSGQPWTEAATVNGSRLLVHSRALSARGEIVGIIQAARPLDEYDQTLTTLEMALLAAGSLGVVFACGAGWLLAGAALRPIDRITQTARDIGAHRDFTRRVDYRGPNDEVGRLATTLNAMLIELHATYQQVAQALAAQRRFVGDASHELRTPLTTIRGNLELLRREPPIAADDRHAVLSDTIEETERLSRLSGDLLALARADAGWRPSVDHVPLAPLLAEVGRQAGQLAPERPIEIAAGEHVVAANRDLLKQVLLILVDNAVKHTPAGTPIAITAAAEPRDLAPPSGAAPQVRALPAVAIRVCDTGGGVAPEALPHIFERFYRGDNSARTAGGAGLGLSIAQSLVELQGGTIVAESNTGAGSTFTIRLPAKE
jgi:two-component system OmpR family sensor kinase